MHADMKCNQCGEHISPGSHLCVITKRSGSPYGGEGLFKGGYGPWGLREQYGSHLYGTETQSALLVKPLSAFLGPNMTHFEAFQCLTMSDTTHPEMENQHIQSRKHLIKEQ